MTKKSKVTDEQIVELIYKGYNNTQIALEFHLKPSGKFSNRCRDIRKSCAPETVGRHGKPINEVPLPEVPEEVIIPVEPYPEPIQPKPTFNKPFPFVAKEQVRFGGRLHTVRHVGKDRMTMYENASLRGVTIMLDDYNSGKVEIIGTENRPDIKTIGEDVVLKGRTGEFADGRFKPINEVVRQVDKIGKSVEDLFKKGIDETLAEVVESAASGDQPLHLDLEMDDMTDPVEPFGPINLNDEEPDYIDAEWFDKPIPRKGTVERAIWDKAYKEIGEIQTLRATLLSALNRGDRLPNTYVDRYNKYVTKYSGEVGA